jgi:hypothetical protein
MSIQVDSEVHAWLHEHGLVPAAKASKATGRGSGGQVLPAHVSSGLLSGAAFASLLNGIFAKHGLKQRVTTQPGDSTLQTWELVSRGLHRLSVELDEASIQALASGDVPLVAELLTELHQVYQHWVTQEASKRRRRQAERRAQPQQGGSYARAAAAAGKVGVQAVDRSQESEDAGSMSDPTPRDVPSSVDPMSVEPTPREPAMSNQSEQADVQPHAQAGKTNVAVAPSEDQDPAGAVSKSVVEDLTVGMRTEQEVSAHVAQRSVPAVPLPHASPERENRHAKPAQAAAHPRDPMHGLLSNIAPDSDIDAAATAPELFALSMITHLRITLSQARALLIDNGRRLARAFEDDSERNAAHLTRWLRSLCYYNGALAELVLLRPEHTEFVLNILGHGLRTASPAVAEWACRILSSFCGCLLSGHLGTTVSRWFLESTALRDLMTLLSSCQAAQPSIAALVFNCSGKRLLQVLAQNLKQVSIGEQEYLASVHLILRSFLEQPEMVQACTAWGVFSHFLARCVQRLGDERSTPATQQAAALLASELWLVSVESKGTQDVASPEGPGDLLAALKQASQGTRNPTLCMVVFSCLSRLLGVLCSRCDPENTPAVYRTFVYALVEAEDSGVRDFPQGILWV